jgi:hypothetical protein
MKARLRKQRVEQGFNDEGEVVSITTYLGEVPCGGSINYAWEVQASSYGEAKRKINALAYHEHRLRPRWGK